MLLSVLIYDSDCMNAHSLAMRAYQVTEQIAKYFTENPNATVFAGNFNVEGDRTVMKAAVDYGNKNGKAIYVFSVDTAKGQVAHQNYLPKEIVKSKKLDAKTWLGEVSKILGGKVSLEGTCSFPNGMVG
jgi:hypothetical protein